ncbi:putative membrane protein [Actinomycetales bacterium JB111]|nr:putative membrane protein [Actinomycetales bacterium JB111]
MALTPDPWWAAVSLAIVLIADAAMSVRPAAFIRDCLDGVGFPRDWWWTLIVIKLLAATGLLAGVWLPGMGSAANIGVIAYLLTATAAHIRADFTGREFWVNCLGMLGLSVAVFIVAFVN